MKQILSENIGLIGDWVIEHPTMIFTDDDVDVQVFAEESSLKTFIATMDKSKFEPIPEIGEPCKFKKIYAYGNDKARCEQEHNRMHFPIEDTPALWTVIKTVGSNLCETVEAWDGNKWLAYQVVGSLVKYDNKIWASKLPTSHTWIAPALTGNGAISWELVQSCPV